MTSYLYSFLYSLYNHNLEIYSTYLVDSVRPHLSAQRMINGEGRNGVQFYQRPVFDNAGDPILIKSRLLSKRPSRETEKLDDYEFIL